MTSVLNAKIGEVTRRIASLDDRTKKCCATEIAFLQEQTAAMKRIAEGYASDISDTQGRINKAKETIYQEASNIYRTNSEAASGAVSAAVQEAQSGASNISANARILQVLLNSLARYIKLLQEVIDRGVLEISSALDTLNNCVQQVIDKKRCPEVDIATGGARRTKEKEESKRERDFNAETAEQEAAKISSSQSSPNDAVDTGNTIPTLEQLGFKTTPPEQQQAAAGSTTTTGALSPSSSLAGPAFSGPASGPINNIGLGISVGNTIVGPKLAVIGGGKDDLNLDKTTTKST